MTPTHEAKQAAASPPDAAAGPAPTTGRRRQWLAWGLFVGLLAFTFVLGMLVVSIMERRWETVRPQIAIVALDEFETDNARFGQNYPREFESFNRTKETESRTAFGGSYPRDYLEDDPRQVLLFAGYAFSRDFKQARGHAFATDDIRHTLRTTRADGSDTGQPGTCWTCKGTSTLKLMNEMGIDAFYATPWKELSPKFQHGIGCLDCHDPKTMNLRVARPAIREAFKRRGRDIDQATEQEKRSLVCAQCHVEYYFGNRPDENAKGEPTFGHKGTHLTHPWDEGTTVDAMEAYYAARPGFFDWVHPVSGTRMIKAQHPDWEVYESGIHAYRNVACADCHMPYRTEGGVKFSNHHVQSPLLDIAASCGVCHRWSEEEVRTRVTEMQRKQQALKTQVEDALVQAHFDVAACIEAGVGEAELAPLRDALWRGQFRWDYVSANNGMGFHSPQECMRVLGTAAQRAAEVRVRAAWLLAAKGVRTPPAAPDVTQRTAALAIVEAFEAGTKDPNRRPRLLAPVAAPVLPPAVVAPPPGPAAAAPEGPAGPTAPEGPAGPAAPAGAPAPTPPVAGP